MPYPTVDLYGAYPRANLIPLPSCTPSVQMSLNPQQNYAFAAQPYRTQPFSYSASQGCPTDETERIYACSAALAACDFGGDPAACEFFKTCCSDQTVGLDTLQNTIIQTESSGTNYLNGYFQF